MSTLHRARRQIAAIAAFAVSSALLFPSYAAALRTWSEGTESRPFSVSEAHDVVITPVRGESRAVLERKMLWEYKPGGPGLFEPFSVQGLANGNVLIASRGNEVLEINRAGRVVWSYTRVENNPNLINVYSAQRLPNGNTLITDRRADFVIEVNPAKQIVWRYGVTPESLAPGSLVDPFSAVRLPNGNTLITDNRFATRVLEIRTSDYNPTAPNLGYTESSIVWRYGLDNNAGTAPGQLASPRFSQRLPNGNTLITDSADQVFAGNRIIEVSPAGEIVWQFGQAGTGGADEGLLNKPSTAIRMENGNTLIAEEDSRRVLEINTAGKVVDLYGLGEFKPEQGELGSVRSLYRWPDGATLIADQGHQRVIEIGYATSGEFTSESLSLGLPGVKKTIGDFEVIADTPEGTSVSIAYSLDGAAWVTGGKTVRPPAGTTATSVKYRVTLHSDSAALSPQVREVRIAYDVAPKDSKPPAGGDGKPAPPGTGTGGGKPGGGSNKPGGSHTAARPTRRPGSTSGKSSGQQPGSGQGNLLATAPESNGESTEILADPGATGDPTYARGMLFASTAVGNGLGLGGLGAPIGPHAAWRAFIVLGVSYAAGIGAGSLTRRP